MNQDTYHIGDYVRRWAQFQRPVDPRSVVCHVTDPVGRLSLSTIAGHVVQQTAQRFFWHTFAGQIGQWWLRWWDAGQSLADNFAVIETPPDTSSKGLPCLSDAPDLTLVPLVPVYLETVRQWRNRDDVRRWFYSSDVITPEAQRDWYYTRYLPDPTDLMWVALWKGQPVGTGALTHVDLAKREGEWSRLMIGEDCARGKGLAGRIAALVRDYALDSLNLERIYGSLYTANQNTLHIDMAAGYLPVREADGITYVELRRKDWRPGAAE